jgi:hypothetical protein
MQRIHIFRTGTHTSSSGTTLSFSESDVAAMVAAYDPSLHEAPIVVGHPKDNAPAFGWIKALAADDGAVFAEPNQVNPDFAEQVKAGAYKKVSASFYSPDAPSNPKPGAYYLRHVGFLGAQPPAIKGLEGIQFSGSDEGVIEFAAEWETAGVFRRLREFFIEKFGLEAADKAIPAYLVEGAEDAARQPAPEPADYTEPTATPEEQTMTPEQIKQMKDDLEAQQAALEAERAEFAEQQKQAAERATAERNAAIAARVKGLVDAGRILPADADGITAFAQAIDHETTVEFGETKTPAVEYFFGLMDRADQGPAFGEAAPSDGDGDQGGDGMSAEAMAAKALEFIEQEKAAGRRVSYTTAVQRVMAA